MSDPLLPASAGLVARLVSGEGAVRTAPLQSAVEELALAVNAEGKDRPYGIVITEPRGLTNAATVWSSIVGARNLVAPVVLDAFEAGSEWLKTLAGSSNGFSLISTSKDRDSHKHLIQFVRDRLGQHNALEDIYLLLSTAELKETYGVQSAAAQEEVFLAVHVGGRTRQRVPPVLRTRKIVFADVNARSDDSNDDGSDAPTKTWREGFIEKIPTWTAQQVADQGGHNAKNKSALASRWASEGKVFAVKWGGKVLFPQFQFRHGEPRPIIAKILQALGHQSGNWDRAFFFASPNAYLNGDRPMDRLDEKQMEAQLVQLADRHVNPADAF